MDSTAYRSRREALRSAVPDGFILLPGHQFQPRNYRDNPFPFRQSSHVLYFSGVELPGVFLVMGPDGDTLYGSPEDVDDVVWHGAHDTLEDVAERAGIPAVRDVADLPSVVREAQSSGCRMHYLPPFQADVIIQLSGLLDLPTADVMAGASGDLLCAVARLRSVKSDQEIAEIEEALEVTAEMHVESMRKTAPGVLEADLVAAIQEIALSRNRAQSYNPIVTVRGEVLHNNSYDNTLQAGQLLLNDSGAESSRFYASDITRTYPVDGQFSAEQGRIYQCVLDAQLAAIDAVRPGTKYRDVHLLAARVMAEGLVGEGLMQGDPDDAVEAGAHALFFPHGLGHMLGLDVHDMEDLGEKNVGYSPDQERSQQFGLGFLRFARPLEPGHVFTIEPGIYFIPALIDRWEDEGRHREFINYDRLGEFREFGGIRIEDDIVCTEDGARVLGPEIPKSIEELEAVMAL